MATSINLSKITKVDLRDCWQNEATDFTPWLATEENMSLSSSQSLRSYDEILFYIELPIINNYVNIIVNII